MEAKEELGSYFRNVRPEVQDLVPLKARRVLDVGCGAGALGASLKARQPVEVHGVELVAAAAESARELLDEVWNSTIEDALAKLPNGHYDCIVVADVLEHLVDPWDVLRALKEKLAPGGNIAASIPNVQNWGVLADTLQGRWDYRSEGILDRTHLRFFTRKTVCELFWTAGYRIDKVGTSKGGRAAPRSLLRSMDRSGLSTEELVRDGQTCQFLIDATIPPPVALPKVSILILNWNGKEDTLECLASVRKLDYPNYEVAVVDNGSADGSAEAIAEQFPDMTVLQTGANLGYAGGNNVGIEWALERDTDCVLLLNNDTVVSSDLLDAFVRARAYLPSGSILGAKIFFYDQPDHLWFAGGQWKARSRSFEHLGHGQSGLDDFERVAEVDFVTGCALFADAETFRAVGLLDERFFLSYEEVDWCYRAKANGHRCIVVPEAKLWHKVSASFGGSDTPIFSYFMVRNQLLWARKHASRSVRIALHKRSLRKIRRFFLPKFKLGAASGSRNQEVLVGFRKWIKRLRKNLTDPVLHADLMALRDYYLGRFGDCPPRVRALRKRPAKKRAKTLKKT